MPTIQERVESVIAKVRPYIQSDGGDITLVAIHEDTGIVEVSLHGACNTCPSSTATLKGGVERMMRQEVPEIKEVVTV
jgi:Fe-S cluster biogenesis protein NfuA